MSSCSVREEQNQQVTTVTSCHNLILCHGLTDVLNEFWSFKPDPFLNEVSANITERIQRVRDKNFMWISLKL